MINVVMGAFDAAAKRPPCMRERCFLTIFISVIGAPDFSKLFVTAFKSAIEILATGKDNKLDPPPEINAIK